MSQTNMYSWRIWWRAARPFSFPASAVPVLLGAAVAWSQGFEMHVGLCVLSVIGAVMAHTGSNMINDYVDFKKGVDRAGSLGGSGILIEGILSPRAILMGSMVSFVIAAAIALPLCIHVGMPLVWLILAGFVASVEYVLPPFGLKYRAFGDLAVFSAFGLGITLGSYMVQTGFFSWTPIFYAVPFGMLVAAILHTNNIRDMSCDRASSFKTFAGILGPLGARKFYAVLVFGAYLITTAFCILKIISPGSLAVLLTLPIAIKAVARVLGSSTSNRDFLVGADAQTAQLNLIFGLAMIAGIVAWHHFS